MWGFFVEVKGNPLLFLSICVDPKPSNCTWLLCRKDMNFSERPFIKIVMFCFICLTSDSTVIIFRKLEMTRLALAIKNAFKVTFSNIKYIDY